MSKTIVDPHGYKDWTLKTAIESQIVENLRVDIAAQTIPTLAIDIAAQSLSTLNVSIASSAVTLNVSIVSSTATLSVNIANEVVSTGQVRPALSLDGISSYVNFGSGPGTQIGGAGNSFSIVIMCRRKLGGVTGYIVGQGTATYNKGLHVGYRGANVFTFAFYGDDLDTPPLYPDVNVKVTWICTYDAPTRTQKIYRFKDLVASRTASNDYLGTGDMLVGKAPWGYYFGGDVYLVLIYKGKVLTQDEVNMIVDNPYSPPTGNLTCFWRFDEGAGNIVRDHAGYDDNGTIYGATWVSERGSVSSVINVNITSQSISTLNVNIASSAVTLNVSIQSSAVTLNMNIVAQTIDVNVLAPGGRAVSVAGTITMSSATAQVGVSPDSEVSILSLTGRGRLISLGLYIVGVSDTIGAGSTYIRIYVDGALKMNLGTWHIDRLNGAVLASKLAAVNTRYEAPVLNPRGGLTWCVTPSGSYAGWRSCGVVLNPDVEFTSSLTVAIYQAAGYGDVNVWATMLYGVYT